MDRVSTKLTSIALAAVLCFWMAFPVSAFVKPQKAEAIAPAIPISILFGTAALVGGVAVAGTTSAQYNANLQSVCDGFQQATAQWSQSWSDYVSAQGSFEQAMSSCVTEDGNIKLQTLSDAGFFDSLNSYTAYCVQNGTMVNGTTSLDAQIATNTIDGKKFYVMSSLPTWANGTTETTEKIFAITCQGRSVYNGRGQTEYHLTWHSSHPVELTYRDYSGGYLCANSSVYTKQVIVYDDGEVYVAQSWSSTNDGYSLGRVVPETDYLIQGSYVISNGTATVGTETREQAVVTAGNTAAQNATVQPFEPTAEQLASGFDSSAVVDAINSGTAETGAGIQQVISTLTGTIGGVLNDIKTGVNGLETALGTAISTGASTVVSGVSSAINTGVNTLSTVLNDIKTASQTIEQTLGGAISTTLTGIATGIAGVGTTLGDIWGDLQGWYSDWLAWVGTTPLGALIAQVIAALNAGVLDLAGLLELVNAGVLDLSTAIELVQTAVQDGVAEITGAIEGIQFPSFEWPKVEGTPQVALPPGDMRSSMDAVIQDKAPFAYMYTFGEGIQSLEYSQEPKFRMRQTFDIVADEVEIDINAEPWLNRDIGGVTIAQLLRASVTLTLCMGLLYGAYKTAMAAVKAG